MKKIPNTTKEHMANPSIMLMEAMLGGTSRAIENQEAKGQKDLCQSSQLPRKGFCDVENMLVNAGAHIPAPSTDDDLFRDVLLPEGWKVEATNHSMWSSLKDEQGRKRASIFYKAAFYDRDAFIRPTLRYKIDRYAAGYENDMQCKVLDWDDSVLFETEKVTMPKDTREESLAAYNKQDELTAQAVAFLKANYPDYENPAAYW